MIRQFVYSVVFCLGESLLSSILIVQQAFCMDYIKGKRQNFFPDEFGVYLAPFAFRVVGLQLFLQFLIVFAICLYGGRSGLKIIGGVLLSMVIWSFLFFCILEIPHFRSLLLLICTGLFCHHFCLGLFVDEFLSKEGLHNIRRSVS